MPQTSLGPFTVTFNNSEEFHLLKGEIFTHDHYYFETDNPTPLIIDAGAHIGLATLYFKKLYPGARIQAIEPHPQNFALLQQNVADNMLEDVTLHQVALSNQTGTQEFYSDQSDNEWFSTAGFTKGAWTGSQSSSVELIPTQPLSDFLTEPIDFLKMDIEGAETLVLSAAKSHLKMVQHLMIEFHPGVTKQSLEDLASFLKAHFPHVELWQKGKPVIAKYAQGLVLIEAWR